jgi:hypothetical protein
MYLCKALNWLKVIRMVAIVYINFIRYDLYHK